jgi:hypothetical protein
MKKLTKILDAVLSRVLILLMFLLVVSVLWQVISRYVFSSPSSWTEELARFLLIWISLLGAAYAFRPGGEPAEDRDAGADLLLFRLGAGFRRRQPGAIDLGAETILGRARAAHGLGLLGNSCCGTVDLPVRISSRI